MSFPGLVAVQLKIKNDEKKIKKSIDRMYPITDNVQMLNKDQQEVKMKIEINLYSEDGTTIVGKAIETNCQSLIINGVHIIANGGINAEMRDLMAPTTADQIGMRLVPELDNPDC